MRLRTLSSRTLSLALAMYCFPICCFSQTHTFQKAIRGSISAFLANAKQTSDKGYILAGDRNTGVLLTKLDSLGNRQWSKSYKIAATDYPMDVIQASDGGFVICAITYSGSPSRANVYVIRTDTGGNQLWSKSYGEIGQNEYGYSVIEANDKGYVILGTKDMNTNLSPYLIKTDSMGEVMWSKTLQVSDDVYDLALVKLTDDLLLLYTQGASGVYAIRMDMQGTSLWSKTFTTTAGYFGLQSATATPDGGFVAAAYFCLKADGAGNIQWSKKIRGSDGLPITRIGVCSDGGYVGVMETVEGIGMAKMSSTGSVLWSKAYRESATEMEGKLVMEKEDGGYFIIANPSYAFGNPAVKYYLVKTDATGNAGCNTYASTIIDSSINITTQSFTPVFGICDSFHAVNSAVQLVSLTEDTLCQVLAIDEVRPGAEVSIYPNPSAGLIHVSSGKMIQKITAYDMTGRQVFTTLGINKEMIIDMSMYSTGMYYLIINTGDQVYTRRLLLQ
jgi:hypothetical protein